MIETIALAPLEKAINHYLSMDPDVYQKRKALDGKCLKLVIKPCTLYFLFEKEKIHVLSSSKQKPDATLIGYPLAFLKLHFSDDAELFSLFKGEITMEGDIEVGQRVKTLFDTIDIDWEEHLSQLTGDIVAHQLTNIVKKTKDIGSRLIKSTQLNMTDYLQEECRILPTREELSDFFDDIDNLRLRLDRLEAHMKEHLK